MIEVADTTLKFDLGGKAALYATHAVPEYWVADVTGRLLHQSWQPDGTAYRERRTVAFGASLTAATIPGLTIDTSGLG